MNDSVAAFETTGFSLVLEPWRLLAGTYMLQLEDFLELNISCIQAAVDGHIYMHNCHVTTPKTIPRCGVKFSFTDRSTVPLCRQIHFAVL